MKPVEIYKQFLLQVNKNDTNTNTNYPKGIFILLFNEQKRQWLDDKVKNKEDSDYIEDLQILLETNTFLIKDSEYSNRVDFKLPNNFFRRATSYSIASKNNCKNITIINWFFKPKNKNVLLQNDDYNPSFEYQETLAELNNNKLSVYKSDFNIDSAYLDYYREPLDLDIEGYIHIDGTKSKDIEIDLDKKNIEEIITRTALYAVRNAESVEQMQILFQQQQQREAKQ